MQDGTAEFSELMARVREGSQQAAWELFSQYGELVFRVVRSKLPRDLRRAFDSADFVQVAWGSIFRHRSRLARLKSPGEFIAFLATVAANKVRMEVRRRCLQKKRNVNRERPLDSAAVSVATSEPTASQVAMAREKWFGLLEGQPAHYQEVIRLRYLGYSSRDIAVRVGLDEGTVRRILRNIFRKVMP